MIVRAKLVRIALLSTALGALAGCDTVGGASAPSAARSAVSSPTRIRASPPSMRARIPAGGRATRDQSERQAEGSAGRLARHQLSGSHDRRRRRGAARRRPGQRLGALSVQHRRHGAPMRSRRSLASRPQDRRQGRSGDRAGRHGRDLQRAAEDHGDTEQRQDGRLSQTYQVEASTDGVTAGAFRVVTDPIMVPMSTLQLADVYSITVGFEGGTGGPSPARHKNKTRTG